MNSNSILGSFGLDPEDYDETDVIESGEEGETDIFLVERKRTALCASCGSPMHIHHRYVTSKSLHPHAMLKTSFLIERIVYRCAACSRCATLPLKGMQTRRRSTAEEARLMREDLQSGMTFKEVARSHGVSVARAIQAFDEMFPAVARSRLPRIMCIDEIRFGGSADPYCCVIMDFESQMPVDIIKSRRKEWLDEYFSSMPSAELRNVRCIISDMFDGYARMARAWFPKAVHVVDRFHVVQLARNAVNSVRTKVMKGLDQSSPEYRFMKSNWESFLVRRRLIPDRWYGRGAESEGVHFDEMVMRCLRLDEDFLISWGQYQDLLSVSWGDKGLDECLRTVDFIARDLGESRYQEVAKAGASFRKWRVEIARAMAKNDVGQKLTNGKMECLNNHLKTIIKKGYGYRNFERFRKRSLLLLRYEKEGAK